MDSQSKVLPLINTTISNELKKTYLRMEVPQLYHGKTLKNFIGFESEVEKSLSAVLDGLSLFLTGSVGTGKTHLAVALMMEWGKKFIVQDDSLIPYGKKPYPLFLSSSEFFLQLKDTFGDSKVSEQDIIQQYDRSPLLVIDDIGSEKISDWSRQMFYVLIDRRYRNQKQTIITSNLNLKQISELIDDRISSRIVGMGKVVELVGEDYRLK